MKIERFNGYMDALSLIHHGGDEKTGNTPVLRRVTMYVEGHGEMPVPYINGNAIRGKLRRLLMRDFLQRVGMYPDQMDHKLYHAFFTGGALESTDEASGSIDLEFRKEIRRLLPPLALIGCSIGNQMIQGKLKVGHAFPVCQETAPNLPEALRADERAAKPVRIFTGESFTTRRDDLRAGREEGEQAVQMKVSFECFTPGTRFHHWWMLEYATETERACFGHMVDLFRADPFLGGKSGSGNGEVAPHYDGIPESMAYLDFIKGNREEILTMIDTLGGRI